MAPFIPDHLREVHLHDQGGGLMGSTWLICFRNAANYDNTEIFFQQVKANTPHVPRNESLSSLDSISSKRSSNTSCASNYTHLTVPSPVSATFSLRSKPSLQRGLIFQRIPQGVYDCILDQLQELHADQLSPSCATCYMRDLVALQLTSRSWDKAVRKTL